MKKNNNKISIILSVFALAFLVLIIFFINSLFNEIQKNSKDLISAKNNIAALNAQKEETENFIKNYEAYKSNLEKLDELFIDPDNPVDFIKFLEKTAADSEVTFKVSLPPSRQSIRESSSDFFNFQFSSAGNFSNILKFAEKIEMGPYLIEIQNLTIRNSQESKGLEEKNVPEKAIAADYSSRKVDANFTIEAFINK